MEPESDFLSILKRELHRLNPARSGLLLAVSGGADSMALLHGAARLRDELQQITVAHLNHNLRGEESAADADLVALECQQLSLPLTVEKIPEGRLQLDSRGSLEESARRARYAFLERAAAEHHCDIIVTAHHRQDVVETLLLQLLRGTGLRGLRGIPDRRQLGNREIIRPLLTVPRRQIRRFIREHNIAFREDGSNLDLSHARNRMRCLLELQEPSQRSAFEQRVFALALQAAATVRQLDRLSGELLAACCIEVSENMVILDRLRLEEWNEPLVRHALVYLWDQQQWPRQQMSASQWHRLSTAAFTGTPRRWNLPGNVRLRISGCRFILERLKL